MEEANINNQKPVVSVITACLNSDQYIEDTIESVIKQTYPNIEYVIIDGGSTDNTLNIIKKYDNQIANWISEPDNGVYDAMNKGIVHSTGEIIYFLNAGDYLYDNEIIEKIVNEFLDESVLAVYGNVEVINYEKNKKSIRGCKVTYNNLLYRRVCHQALFVRRSLFDEMGLFSTSFKLSSDHEFIIKCIKKYSDNFLYLDKIIAKYRDDGMSCKMMEKTKIEDLKIISSNYNIFKFLLGSAVCGYVILKYKIPQVLNQ
ncbi:glycosyl transferase family 2 [Methanosalsum zhilinae DSM 4017]|uniref:Glycosyl transferase family 2 n=1 Tax=Methanosalsum zhilinae (strain DSM 4017 / NBRC 107636 / OCM 62 / WeN5) TaxID=679901 RepID=F7XPW5_METZD|nr:glycosyltransferase family 2 protein [Methanosalsum zhilinae]AEH61486.1 glycosyl transferase family 2 [Methanosalsum zhilinae DSM 4017]